MPRAAGVAVLGAAIVIAASPLSAQVLKLPKAQVDYDREVDFQAFRKFQWRADQDRLEDPARHMAMVTAIERELEKKGLLKPLDGAADVRVRFFASVDKKVRGTGRQETSWSGDLRTSIDFEKMAEGTLIIELYDASDGKRIWRGTTTQVFRPGSLEESDIRAAVALVLRSYPPAPSAPPAIASPSPAPR
jgi:hypothetical protein